MNENGGGEIPSPEAISPSQLSNREFFLQSYSYYLALGMSYDEYWNGDPWLAKSYRDAYEIKKEARNQELYLQGVYNYRAIQAALEELAYGLSGKKGTKPEGYLEYPIPITKREQEAETERRIKKTYEWIKLSKARQKEMERRSENGN